MGTKINKNALKKLNDFLKTRQDLAIAGVNLESLSTEHTTFSDSDDELLLLKHAAANRQINGRNALEVLLVDMINLRGKHAEETITEDSLKNLPKDEEKPAPNIHPEAPPAPGQ